MCRSARTLRMASLPGCHSTSPTASSRSLSVAARMPQNVSISVAATQSKATRGGGGRRTRESKEGAKRRCDPSAGGSYRCYAAGVEAAATAER